MTNYHAENDMPYHIIHDTTSVVNMSTYLVVWMSWVRHTRFGFLFTFFFSFFSYFSTPGQYIYRTTVVQIWCVASLAVAVGTTDYFFFWTTKGKLLKLRRLTANTAVESAVFGGALMHVLNCCLFCRSCFSTGWGLCDDILPHHTVVRGRRVLSRVWPGERVVNDAGLLVAFACVSRLLAANVCDLETFVLYSC